MATEVFAAMSVRAARTNVDDPQHGVIKSRVAGTLLASIVLTSFLVANLPYRYAESEVEWSGYLEVSNGGSYLAYQEMPTMAGWPFRYWVRYGEPEAVQDRIWLPARLFVNLAMGVCLSLALYLFMQFRHRRLSQSPESHRLRLQFDCGIAFAILAVPLGLFAWQYRTTAYHRQIASDLERAGSCCLSCWLPAPISDHVPASLKRSFARIRQIHVYAARQQAAEVIMSVPTLAALHCYAGVYDSQPLRKLLANPHLCALQFSRRELSEGDLDVIRKLRWIDQLYLDRTNFDATQLKSLDHWGLKVVDLSFTNVALSEIGKPSWSATLERLTLSRPDDGIESSLVLEGWPQLKDLKIERQSEVLNDAVLSIRLVDLPRLENLHIDRVQKHDLVLRNLPRLKQIEEGVSDLRYLMNTDTMIPGLTWLRSLEIDGVDSLTAFGCFARDLEHFSIRCAPRLRRLAIGSYMSTLLGEISPQPVDPQLCRKWIKALGKMDCPSKLELAFLPLDQEDLSPLIGNKRIRHLRFEGMAITFAQVQQLAGLKNLKSLSIPSTPLQQNDLSWLLDQFPNIENLTIDSNGLTNFDLKGRGQLRDVRVTPMAHLAEIRIVDLPQLRTSIRITQPPKKLEVRNAPMLIGLAVEGPWPEVANLEGLRDLEWFTGGGARIDDQVANEILNCDALDRLTLAYPSISASTLRRIGTLKELTFLALPGANVNDDVVKDWSELLSLWEVNLDDTQISVETIAWLSRMESLRRLSINRVPLTEAAAEALGQLTQVSELYLVGVSMSPKHLRPLLKLGNLETLDLSGWKLDENLIEMLCSDGAQLKHLILRDTEINASAFQRLLAASPAVYLEMGEIPDFVDRHSLVELHRRAQLLRREMNTGWRLMLRPRDDIYRSAAANPNPSRSEPAR